MKANKEHKAISSPSTEDFSEEGGSKRGMQTMLRVASYNHIRISEIADKKANILISVNAIIISVILSVLLRRIEPGDFLLYPTLFLLIVASISLTLAIISTRPQGSKGMYSIAELQRKKTNLLFFGNFYRMPQYDYQTAMRLMMTDPDYLYGAMVKDIYFMGVAIAKKYRLTRIAYTVFMYGLIVAVGGFIAILVLMR
jgi:hypothetical protein